MYYGHLCYVLFRCNLSHSSASVGSVPMPPVWILQGVGCVVVEICALHLHMFLAANKVWTLVHVQLSVLRGLQYFGCRLELSLGQWHRLPGKDGLL
jgi:hypothetical protein